MVGETGGEAAETGGWGSGEGESGGEAGGSGEGEGEGEPGGGSKMSASLNTFPTLVDLSQPATHPPLASHPSMFRRG